MFVYLDNCSTTRVRDEVLEIVLDSMSLNYGNPSSLHRMGLEVEKKVNLARKYLSKLINSNDQNIIFTSGGTESNNLAIHNYLKNIDKSKNIVTTKIEHSSVSNIFKDYEKKGTEIRYLDVDKDGFVVLDDLKAKIDENTILFSVIFVNNEIGTVQKLEKLSAEAKKINKNIKIHVDGIQALGKIEINVKKLDVDTMSFSAHKIHGPKGVGALYVKNKSAFNSSIFGGGQENNIRPGTENTHGIFGFGRACELLATEMKDNILKLKAIKQLFMLKLYEHINDIQFNGPYNHDCLIKATNGEILSEESVLFDDYSAPHVLSVSFKGIKGEVLLHFLENYDIYVSTGSACSSNLKHQSNTLKSIGLDKEMIDGTIRLSFGKFNSLEEVDYAVKNIKKNVEEIRKVIG